jgi:hypothetical protein
MDCLCAEKGGIEKRGCLEKGPHTIQRKKVLKMNSRLQDALK